MLARSNSTAPDENVALRRQWVNYVEWKTQQLNRADYDRDIKEYMHLIKHKLMSTLPPAPNKPQGNVIPKSPLPAALQAVALRQSERENAPASA